MKKERLSLYQNLIIMNFMKYAVVLLNYYVSPEKQVVWNVLSRSSLLLQKTFRENEDICHRRQILFSSSREITKFVFQDYYMFSFNWLPLHD